MSLVLHAYEKLLHAYQFQWSEGMDKSHKRLAVRAEMDHIVQVERRPYTFRY